jgi:hypothetical protein
MTTTTNNRTSSSFFFNCLDFIYLLPLRIKHSTTSFPTIRSSHNHNYYNTTPTLTADYVHAQNSSFRSRNLSPPKPVHASCQSRAQYLDVLQMQLCQSLHRPQRPTPSRRPLLRVSSQALRVVHVQRRDTLLAHHRARRRACTLFNHLVRYHRTRSAVRSHLQYMWPLLAS